jgi:hypothetical protein
MAPGLEEEVVMQVMSKGNDRQYLSDRIEALRELGFKINDKAVKTAIERYELLQAYNSQDNSPRARKKRVKEIKEKFKQVCEEQIEKLKEEDPSVISVKIVRYFRGCWNYCKCCGEKKSEFIGLRYNYLNEEEGVLSKRETEDSTSFEYCFGCGHILQH